MVCLRHISQIDQATKGSVTYTSNTPYIFTSCYEGIFSAETPSQPSPCPSNTNSPNGNALYCLVFILKNRYYFCKSNEFIIYLFKINQKDKMEYEHRW